ncbi:hypothetical protein DFH09DRAFT_1321213 [Mycena vulgaris]|nr:hypothetical protein DFH09DRAFT_1321213 [Mycena vulgaris]
MPRLRLATPPTTFIGPVAAAAAISPSLSNSVLLLAGDPALFRSSPAFTSVTHTAVADSCATAIGRRKVSDAQSKVFVSLFTLIFPIHPFISRAVAPARYPEGSARALLPLALSPFNRRQHLAAAHSATQCVPLAASSHSREYTRTLFTALPATSSMILPPFLYRSLHRGHTLHSAP